MKVYVVLLYEDLKGVFSSREKAEQWITDNEAFEDWRDKYEIYEEEVQE